MPQPNIDEQIQIDTDDDNDSLLDAQSIVGSNLTISSTVRDYCFENGRRYHAYRNGQYPVPNDQEEQDRLTLLHQLFKSVTGGELHRAPVLRPRHRPQRVLDVGTGTGVWALDIADAYPHAEIVGTDLSPIQPRYTPPNCSFIIDDAESDWAFPPEEAFDYVHGRSLGGSIADWPRFLQQAYQHVKPGGWVEIQEFETWIRSDDGTDQQAVRIHEYQRKLDEASRRFGKRMNIASSVRGWMQDAGFQHVTDDTYKCPLGPWARNPHFKELGRMGKAAFFDTIEPYSLALLTRVMDYTYEQAQRYAQDVRHELVHGSFHIYTLFHYVYGQKPPEKANNDGHNGGDDADADAADDDNDADDNK
ncbi:class I SAM-dependent methyltransferase [Aspergillus brunneoviolaceus CBS 621.78]|uniref:TAM domain methyltransferase n=1 Tax=Aspergillus brunneoviolaceus CBS 621.78 TaxID=1450534 RepID=A0ACD1GKT4_9EURO|nr:TAM domain methyltransferase [Aspergillus brunneoviolaceus CBS 621.78]RAH49795.1 TAM domain methyltransferase [Aspergillus brunneoviolaceus CBS 621.78]